MKIYIFILSFFILSCSSHKGQKRRLIGCWVDVSNNKNVLEIDKDSIRVFDGTVATYHLSKDSFLTLMNDTITGEIIKISVLNEDSLVLEPTFFSLKRVLIKKACE